MLRMTISFFLSFFCFFVDDIWSSCGESLPPHCQCVRARQRCAVNGHQTGAGRIIQRSIAPWHHLFSGRIMVGLPTHAGRLRPSLSCQVFPIGGEAFLYSPRNKWVCAPLEPSCSGSIIGRLPGYKGQVIRSPHRWPSYR